MRDAGRITAEVMEELKKMVAPGVTTRDLDEAAEKGILGRGARPTFKGYRGYPASICASVNDEVVHGIPGDRALKEGDLLSIDIGATYKNYVGDMAVTVPVGKISESSQRLIDVTRGALESAIEVMGPNVRLSRISATIQEYIETRGFSVVKKYVGHGIGNQMHEDPQVPNYVIHPVESFDVMLKPGIVLAIEPMVNEGSDDVRVLDDRWTVVTRDGKRSAHFEHTIAVTETGREVLTRI